MSAPLGQKRKMDDEESEGSSGGPLPKVLNVPEPVPEPVYPPLNQTSSVTFLENHRILQLGYVFLGNLPRYWVSASTLGKGAFGEVHLVHSDRIDHTGRQLIHNEFVVKIVKMSPAELDNIAREVEMHQLCRDHKNVLFAGVTYCQYIEQGYRVQMCLEYAALGDLSLFVAKDKTEHHIAYVCREVIQALVYIHGKEIVHGDISFKNVLVTHRGVIKLSDFGMADTMENTREPGKKNRGGTPGFIAPEIVNKEGYDGKADLWSLGVLALSFVMKTNPFKQGMLFDVQTYRKQISEQYYPDIENLKITNEFREFLDDLRQYDPTERSHAHELTLDLFVVDSCNRREFLNFYKALRLRNGMVTQFPDDARGLVVPTSREY